MHGSYVLAGRQMGIVLAPRANNIENQAHPPRLAQEIFLSLLLLIAKMYGENWNLNLI